MATEEDTFMRMDSNSEDEQDQGSVQASDDEKKLMHFLLNGFAMTSHRCVKCDLTLLRNVTEIAESVEEVKEGWFGRKTVTKKLHEKGDPINGVAYCVACKAVVVTNNDELRKMWTNDYKHLMAIDGAVLLAIDDPTAEEMGVSSYAAAKAQYNIEREEEAQYEEEEELEEDQSISHAESAGGLLIVKTEIPKALPAKSKNKLLPKTTGIDTIKVDNVEIELDEDEEEEDFGPIDVTIIEYKKRKQIATKVLGAKMVHGFTLKEAQCGACSMPLMENPENNAVDCVVCPVLEKKILKKMKERKKANEETERQLRIKAELECQLAEDRAYLDQIQEARVTASVLDGEAQKMMQEVQETRKKREEEENKLIMEEKARQSRVNDSERNELIEELRLIRLEREAEKKRMEEERAELQRKKDELQRKKDAEAQFVKDREAERERLIEELRLTKEQKKMEAKLRIAEAREASERQRESERLLEQKEKQRIQSEKLLQETTGEYRQAQEIIKHEQARRQDEVEETEILLKDAETELRLFHQSTMKEKENAMKLRGIAEERLLDAEESLLEAEELALEAHKAQRRGTGDRDRLIEMYRNAEQLRINAEAEESAAREQLSEANRKLDNLGRMGIATEKRLEIQVNEARSKLAQKKADLKEGVKIQRDKLKFAENEMLHARFGKNAQVDAAGDDWEARLLLGKKSLAKEVMAGWTVMPEYCNGRMCNFTPLITKGSAMKCVVCEGCGNGRDGFYSEGNSDAVLDDTRSFVSKKNRFSRISNSKTVTSPGRRVASKEVGRRMMDGWQLLDSPCSECQMPLMCETYGSPEVCVFCDPGNDDDNISVSSRQSITLEIPEDFDPSDANAMAALVKKATASMKSGHQNVPSRNRIPSVIGGPSTNTNRLPPGRNMRSRSPAPRFTPESRNSMPSPRSKSRSRVPRESNESMVINTAHYDDDDASQLSDDMSVAKSVASHTMDNLMSKIESCKAQISMEGQDADAAAELLKKLTAAAAAVKSLETSAE